MKTPVLLQAKRKPVSGYQQSYVDLEAAAIAKLGFEIIELETDMFGLVNPPDYDLTGRAVFCRHYADDDKFFIPYVKQHGGRLVVPDYQTAQDWYKLLPLDFVAREYMGGRKLGWYPLAPYNHLEEHEELNAFKELIEEIYDDFSIDGKVFVKSKTKDSFKAAIYTKKALYDTLLQLIGIGCHKIPTELIASQPMNIRTTQINYKIEEYRCLIIGGKVSTTSLYTDDKRIRKYWDINDFAAAFATQFELQLPNSYDLDIARISNGQLAVVEINDISACGLFADHDVYRLFKDIYKLAMKS